MPATTTTTTTTTTTKRKAVAISAPGKVLFAGGFLVLDRQHTGLVFGLDARIHVVISADLTSPPPAPPPAPPSTSSGESVSLRVVVRSPQFRDARWGYDVSLGGGSSDSDVQVQQVMEQGDGRRQAREEAEWTYSKSSNKFVETAVRYTFTYLAHAAGNAVFGRDTGGAEGEIAITVLADDDYYSSSSPAAAASNLAPSSELWSTSKTRSPQQKQFSDFGVRLADAHKTGLGSSAALTTALVGALVAFYTNIDANSNKSNAASESTNKVVHNLAQAAHCAAQGKVGSGFDVAAAVYGSCLYRRFSPAVLEQVGDPDSEGFTERLHRCVEDLELETGKRWDVEVLADRIKVPQGLVLVLCDVDCGSETPGMVRKMLSWRKEQRAESDVLWGGLQIGQEELCEELRRLSRLPVEVQTAEGYQRLRVTIETMRSLVREMSVKSGVPVEPEVITELLDYCGSVEGVIGGVAPGAGGYDAVAMLVRNDERVMKDLQGRLAGWKSRKDGAEIGNVRLLGVKQSQEGIRGEDPTEERYTTWM